MAVNCQRSSCHSGQDLLGLRSTARQIKRSILSVQQQADGGVTGGIGFGVCRLKSSSTFHPSSHAAHRLFLRQALCQLHMPQSRQRHKLPQLRANRQRKTKSELSLLRREKRRRPGMVLASPRELHDLHLLGVPVANLAARCCSHRPRPSRLLLNQGHRYRVLRQSCNYPKCWTDGTAQMTCQTHSSSNQSRHTSGVK